MMKRKRISRDIKALRPIPVNAGVVAKYRAELVGLVREMTRDVGAQLKAAYQPIAQDMDIEDVLARLAEVWVDKFSDQAAQWAEIATQRIALTTSSTLMRALRDAGWAVELRLTQAMQDALNASVAGHVALIRNIPEQYVQKITEAVTRGYSMGRDLKSIYQDLLDIAGMTERRAAFIARDQCNKANAVVMRTRQLELGISQAIWMHSHAGKRPRPDHVAAHGDIYDVTKGCKISGEYIFPGELPNCRCTCRSILPR